MIGLLRRVIEAKVAVVGESIAAIGHGLCVLVGVERDDDESVADRLIERLLDYRVFTDEQGRMNRSLRDIRGALLLVPQFTLAADTRKGTRPSFTAAAQPDVATRLFAHLCERARARHAHVACGRFGASMQVALVNDGPVTFWLQVQRGPR
ncbi:MAG: D-tyrosyl-tRNA(Tyr) deacylase [Betaproteobacteria bacterium]|nr:D-tyrosyl-tRNA(Tyr) deacylase [Betaproteobacteria bacterium]